MRRAMWLAILAPWLLAAPAQAAFDAEQRAEIVAILREAMQRDPTILRDAITTLQADESAREKAGSREALAAARDHLVTPADPVGGNPRGDVTIVEFFDVRCGYCRKLEPAMARFLAGDKNVRLVYKDLPILGPASVLGAKALLAAQRQNAYETYRDAVMKLPPDLTLGSLETAAKKAGLDWPKLARDMEDPAIRQHIDANLNLATMLNIQGTPALIIGDETIPGAVDANELAALVARARKAKG